MFPRKAKLDDFEEGKHQASEISAVKDHCRMFYIGKYIWCFFEDGKYSICD